MPALLVIFLGSGWEVMINVGAYCNMLASSGGSGCCCASSARHAWRRLRLPPSRFSLASFTIGIAFAAGAAVEICSAAGRGGGASGSSPRRSPLRDLVHLGPQIPPDRRLEP